MAEPLSGLFARFRTLPRGPREVWQGGIVSMPAWVEGPDGLPMRPQAVLWASSGTDRLRYAPLESTSTPFEAAARVLLEFGLDRRGAGCRPARIEVADAALAAYLGAAIGDPDLTIAVLEWLPWIREGLRHLEGRLSGRTPRPDALDGEGVTMADLRAFAEAARAFYDAAPWRHLANDDLIQIEVPGIDPELAYAVVMGEGGTAYGLSFFASREDYESVVDRRPGRRVERRGRWAVLFGPPWEMPFGDLDLFEAHALPVAGPEAYPVAARLGPADEVARPDAAKLAWIEGVLRVLAVTTEDELDAGRWRREVSTGRGRATYTLALPDLLEPPARSERPPSPWLARRAMERVMAEVARATRDREFDSLEALQRFIQERFANRPADDIPSTASTPLERAQDLVYEAFEARGRRQLQLVRRALALSRDCADAYVLLAERASDLGEQVRLYADGVAAGERALGRTFLDEHAGRLWGFVEARPYLRARMGLAGALAAAGRPADALAQYREVLRLDENDHQGARYRLLGLLFEEGRDEEAAALLERFGDEPTAVWRYGRALWAWRRGDRAAAQRLIRKAIRANPTVAMYLANRHEIPDDSVETYALGSPEEALVCVDQLGAAWESTPGALEWVAAEARTLARRARRDARKPRRRR